MTRLLTSLIAILAVANLQAQHQAPKLVVYITIDQLRGDYIEYFYNTLGERGFKRLMNEGIVYNNVEFSFQNINEANAIATLFTGTNPDKHGITSNKQYDFEKSIEQSILNDPEYLGNYTTEYYSAKKLLSSTIGDELKIASKGRSDVYSIAPNAEAAILSAGHAANGAYWIDSYNGKWASTTYYGDIPWYIDRLNNASESISSRLKDMEWTPSLPSSSYNALPYTMSKKAFKHSFNERDKDCYINLKTSAIVNEEVNNAALTFIESAGLATRTCPDMLSITYYAGNYLPTKDNEYAIEIQDIYHRLDKQLASLLDAIDNKIGINNTLIVVTGTGYFESNETYSEGLRIHVGDFHPKRCTALLNMYLMATYGQSQNWVKGFYNNQIFLNKKAIEESGLNLEAVQQKAADFIAEFSGIHTVTTDFSIRRGRLERENSPQYLGSHFSSRGDLIITLSPGWRINNEESGETPKTIRHNAVSTPLIFMGNYVVPQKIYRKINATEIAPSVSHILRIRPPNASKSLPLHELMKN